MDRALGRNGNSGEPADQALADFASTPAGVLLLDVQNEVFRLKRQLVGIAVGSPTSVGEPLNPSFLIATEFFVAVFGENPNPPPHSPHRPAGGRGSHKLHPF